MTGQSGDAYWPPADEHEAFLHTVTYHIRNGSRSCLRCGELPLGSSFSEHLWEKFKEAL